MYDLRDDGLPVRARGRRDEGADLRAAGEELRCEGGVDELGALGRGCARGQDDADDDEDGVDGGKVWWMN